MLNFTKRSGVTSNYSLSLILVSKFESSELDYFIERIPLPSSLVILTDVLINVHLVENHRVGCDFQKFFFVSIADFRPTWV